ncbi:MAG: CHAP domain-containing protein [Methylococcaceae bacterium]
MNKIQSILRLFSASILWLMVLTSSVMAAGFFPMPPTLFTPANNAKDVPQNKVYFSWSNKNVSSTTPEPATENEVQFSDEKSFSCDKSSTCNKTPTGKSTTLTRDMAYSGKVYFWRVRSKINGFWSDWTTARSFTTAILDFSKIAVDFNSSAYRSNNPLYPAFAPKSVGGTIDRGALGNCTWYANGRARELGFTVGLKSLTGTAKTWATSAKNAGIVVDSTPTAGSIAQSTENRLSYGALGHVAFVEKVNANGTLLISESSYAPGVKDWDFDYRPRDNVKPSEFNNYIHVTKP